MDGTDSRKRAGMNHEMLTKFAERLKHCQPLGRLGTTLEAAKSIAFLAGDQALEITGTLLAVDGGLNAVDHCE